MLNIIPETNLSHEFFKLPLSHHSKTPHHCCGSDYNNELLKTVKANFNQCDDLARIKSHQMQQNYYHHF